MRTFQELNGYDFIATWWSWAASNTLQVAAGAALLVVVDGCTRGRLWPQVRAALWSLILLKPLVAPLLALLGLAWSWPLPAALSSVVTPAVGAAAHAPTLLIPSWSRAGVMPSGLLMPSCLLMIWCVGLLAVAWHHRRRGIALRQRLLLASHPAPQNIRDELSTVAAQLRLRRLPELRFSSATHSPVIFGAFRPILLLPVHWQDSTAREHRSHAYLHELAHLKRGDLFIQQLFHLLHLLFWFHPGTAWARRKTDELREVCCDATVARWAPERREGYRRTLLFSVQDSLQRAGVLSFAGSSLVARLYWLDRGCGSPFHTTAAGCSLLLMGTLFLPPSTEAPTESAAASAAASSTAASSTTEATIHSSILQEEGMAAGAVVVAQPEPSLSSPESSNEQLLEFDRIAESQLRRAARGETTSCLQLKYAALYKMARDGDL